MIETIFKGFYERYAETPLVAMLEGFWFMQAPQGTTGTYATFAPVTGRQEYDMSSRLEDILIQISIFTEDSEEAEGATLAARLADWVFVMFDDCSLTLPGGTLVRIDRQSYNLLADPDGGWMFQIDYQLLVQED